MIANLPISDFSALLILLALTLFLFTIRMRRNLQARANTLNPAKVPVVEPQQDYRILADVLPAIVWTASGNGLDDYFNQKWYEYTGLTFEQSSGFGWRKAVHPDDLAEVDSRWEESIASGEFYEVEYRLRRADGQYRWHIVRGVCVRDGGGNILRWFGAATDIEDQKSAERVSLIAVAREKEAIESNRLKSEFLANMSHEIRTPMSGMIGMVDLLLGTPLSAEQKQFASFIKKSSEGLVTIINDILDFSKAEAGHLKIENIPFSPAGILADTIELFKPLAESKKLMIKMELAKNIPAMLIGDSTRIKQILTNLISNAVKFTKEGEVMVRLSHEQFEIDQIRLRIEVEDSGIGIPESMQSKIFLPFTQADVSTTRRFGGSGLGLSICKNLVDLMGGEIHFKSIEGTGSRFCVTLPLKLSLAKIAKPDQNGHRILIAEDNEVNQLVTKRMAERLGFSVDVAQNGREVLKAIDFHAYDLILMDCQMPELDGYETSALIRKDAAPLNRSTPIVAMTANTIIGDRDRCFLAGMNDYLTKPVSFDQLADTLRRWAPIQDSRQNFEQSNGDIV